MPSPTEEWRAALDAALGARVTVVVGPIDAGKTTLVAALAGELASRRAVVAVVDADLGQSEVGPPTTVGLGRVMGPIRRLSDAVLVALHFIGASSPAHDIQGTVEGARRMTTRARAEGFERILVDTSGLVTGRLGLALKQRKIDAIDPDLVLVLERDRDGDAIVRRYDGAARPRIVRLPAGGRPRSLNQAVRRRHRAAALERYLADARLVSLDLSTLAVEKPADVPLGAWVGALCGLDDARGDTLALGVVQEVLTGVVRVLTPLPHGDEVTGLRIGRERRDGIPLAPAPRTSRGGAAGSPLEVRSTPSRST